MKIAGQLRELPSVDEVLKRLEHLAGRYPRALVVGEVRRAIEEMRVEIRAGGVKEPAAEARVERWLEGLERPSIRRVINATGVVLHTNLGRAPLARFTPVAGYSNLEYDLAAARRGKRDVHVAGLLERLLGAPAIAVNNNAAAVYLALNELARGHEVIVSRGELIEIGDGFRIPDIMAASGAVLREVGTTNRTSIEDYREAVTGRTRLLLRVHRSNFRMEGFTARPALAELVALARERGVPLYEDLGSGCVVDLRAYGIEEPLVQGSLGAGVDLVSFSGDKLLGGPQAGILAGRPELVAGLRRSPMYRALRLDKLILEALETSLRAILLERWEWVPALGMIMQPAQRVRERAEGLLARLGGVEAELVAGHSLVGGGSTPGETLPSWLIAIRAEDVTAAERRLREGEPPVIARIAEGKLIIDLRTVLPEDEEPLLQALSR